MTTGAFLLLSLLLFSDYFIGSDRKSVLLPEKRMTTILVADFEGVNSQNYYITDNILSKIRQETVKYENVQVLHLGRAITERDGKNVAIQLGKEKKADLVIWGWYGTTKENAQVSVHYELLTKPGEPPELNKEMQGAIRTVSLEELESFEMQVNLSEEVTYISLVTLGISNFVAQDWAGAISFMTSALDSVPYLEQSLNPEAIYFSRAVAYYFEGENDKAISDFTQVIKLNPNSAGAYINRGSAYGSIGNTDKALMDYTQAITLSQKIEISPELLGLAYYNRGTAYTLKNDGEKAIADFNQSIDLGFRYAAVYINRGAAYNAIDEVEKAIADFSEVIDINPNFGMPYFNIGLLHLSSGNFDQAIVNFNKAIILEPDIAFAYYKRGAAYTYKGLFGRALIDFERAIKLGLREIDLYNLRGIAYVNMGRNDLAVADFTRVINSSPSSGKAYCNRGLAFQAANKIEQAKEDFQICSNLSQDTEVKKSALERVLNLEAH